MDSQDEFHKDGSESPNINEINERDAMFKYHSYEKMHNKFDFSNVIKKTINTSSKKKRYNPDGDVIGRDSNADGFKIDLEMRKSDCGFMTAYNGFNTDPCGGTFANVYVDEYNS